MTEPRLPEWHPPHADAAFAGRVLPGVQTAAASARSAPQSSPPSPPPLSVEALASGILARSLPHLARGITLVESNAARHAPLARELIERLLPHTGQAIRVGISGIPGVGKSTFIEALGTYLCHQNHRVAVLAVDPSSTLSGGSILGDKTRMESLARHPNAFIRPSPSSGTLGGVTRKSRESILLCEAAGYDVILVETVGVGQSETEVRNMTDCFVLLLLPGAGDELQGIKRGIMESADIVVINKADGDRLAAAQRARQDMQLALRLIGSPTPDWTPEVLLAAGLHRQGIDRLWESVTRFHQTIQQSGFMKVRRQQQQWNWFQALLRDEVLQRFLATPEIASRLPATEAAVREGRLTAPMAVADLMRSVDILSRSQPSPHAT